MIEQIRMGLVVLALGSVVPAMAASGDPVHDRTDGFKKLGAAFKRLNDGLRAEPPQAAQLQQAAKDIFAASKAQYNWFPVGSGPRPGVKTAAKADIWSRGVEFHSAQDGFARQALVLQQVANRGDPTAIRVEARKLGAACKNCHDNFREEDN